MGTKVRIILSLVGLAIIYTALAPVASAGIASPNPASKVFEVRKDMNLKRGAAYSFRGAAKVSRFTLHDSWMVKEKRGPFSCRFRDGLGGNAVCDNWLAAAGGHRVGGDIVFTIIADMRRPGGCYLFTKPLGGGDYSFTQFCPGQPKAVWEKDPHDIAVAAAVMRGLGIPEEAVTVIDLTVEALVRSGPR